MHHFWLQKWNKQCRPINAKDIDKVMPMYILIEYSDNYSKTCGSLWEYCKGSWFYCK